MVSRLLPIPLRMKARAGLKYQIKEKVEFSTIVLYTEAYPSHQWKDTAHCLHGTKCQSTKGVHKQGEAWTLKYVMDNVE